MLTSPQNELFALVGARHFQLEYLKRLTAPGVAIHAQQWRGNRLLLGRRIATIEERTNYRHELGLCHHVEFEVLNGLTDHLA